MLAPAAPTECGDLVMQQKASPLECDPCRFSVIPGHGVTAVTPVSSPEGRADGEDCCGQLFFLATAVQSIVAHEMRGKLHGRCFQTWGC